MTATTATMDTRSYTSSSTTTTGAGRNDFGMPGKKIEEVCVCGMEGRGTQSVPTNSGKYVGCNIRNRSTTQISNRDIFFVVGRKRRLFSQ